MGRSHTFFYKLTTAHSRSELWYEMKLYFVWRPLFSIA